MKNHVFKVLVAVTSLVAAVSSHAGLVFTIENPGVEASTVPGVTTETFNSQPIGPFSGSVMGGLGSLSTGGNIVAPDAFGGASPPPGGSDYYAVGVQSGQLQSTLTLATPQHYFGMYWSAGDAGNQLEFFDHGTLLASYVVASITPSLTPAYYGNPNNGLDSSEPFVYLDFTTTGASAITSVVFLNASTGSGFEMDNFSVTSQQITPPGNPVPEGGVTAGMLGGAIALMGVFRRRSRG
jgi:hypothetical protein